MESVFRCVSLMRVRQWVPAPLPQSLNYVVKNKLSRTYAGFHSLDKFILVFLILFVGLREPPYFAGYGKTRLLVHSVVTSKYFDLAIAAVIGLNVITMAMEFYMMPKVSTARAEKAKQHIIYILVQDFYDLFPLLFVCRLWRMRWRFLIISSLQYLCWNRLWNWWH